MSDLQLPDLWRTIELNKIASLIGGGTPSRKVDHYFSGDTPWLTGSDLSDDEILSITESREFITEEAIQNSATNVVPPNTILVTTRVRVGKVAMADVPLCFSQDVTGVVIKDECKSFISPHYLAFFLFANKQRILRYDRGTTISGIQKKDLARLKIFLPPLPEQAQIVSILREADGLRQLQQQAQQEAQTLIPALFHEMFGDPVTKMQTWQTLPFGKLITDLHSGAPLRPSDFVESGFPVLHKGAIRAYGEVKIDSQKKTFTTAEFADKYFERSVITNEYLSITLRDLVPSGPSLGLISKLNRSPYKKYLLAQGAYGFLVNETKVLPEYLVWLSNYPSFRVVLLRYSVGSTQIHIRTPVFLQISVPIPPMLLQKEFAEITNDIRNVSEFTYPREDFINELHNSLLNQAFTGELTAVYRQQNHDLLQQSADARDRLLAGLTPKTAPIEEPATPPNDLIWQGRDRVAESLSQTQQAILQTILADLEQEDERYFQPQTVIANHVGEFSPNSIRRTVALLEALGILTRVRLPIAPAGQTYYETFYRFTQPKEEA